MHLGNVLSLHLCIPMWKEISLNVRQMVTVIDPLKDNIIFCLKIMNKTLNLLGPVYIHTHTLVGFCAHNTWSVSHVDHTFKLSSAADLSCENIGISTLRRHLLLTILNRPWILFLPMHCVVLERMNYYFNSTGAS
jgi:hypothetical protein